MSNILKRPGWASRDVLSEKVKIGDVERTIPGWGPGKEAKRFFAGKIGEEVPTGRYGRLRKVAGTSYREAELAFARYCAESLEIAENVIATKEVKEILRELTAERLQEKGFDSVDEWIQGWIEYAQQNFGMDLTNVTNQRERQVRDAVQDIAQEIEDEVPEEGEADVDEPETAAPAAGDLEEIPAELQQRIINNDIKPQGATRSEDQTKFTIVSFMGQDGDKITYVRLKDVPKNPNYSAALKAVKKVGDIINNDMLAQHVSEIELERGDRSERYKMGQAQAPAPEAPALDEPRAPRAIDMDFNESTVKLNSKQQTILAEQMRIARKQHMQRIEERYYY
jgi:hypothetical protein